jgi:hypothetical protein
MFWILFGVLHAFFLLCSVTFSTEQKTNGNKVCGLEAHLHASYNNFKMLKM